MKEVVINVLAVIGALSLVVSLLCALMAWRWGIADEAEAAETEEGGK